MKNKIIKNKKIIIITLVILSFFIFFLTTKKESASSVKGGDIATSELDNNWKVYKNETYGFELEFPATWQVYEDLEDFSPVINIYNPEFNSKPPYDHFSNISNFSIFPKGIPTEGVATKSIQLNENNLKFNNEFENANNFVFQNGQVWATFINPKNMNENWKPWGFIWLKAKIENEEFICFRNGIEISIEQCDTLGGGDQLEVRGEIDNEIRKTELKILESFKKIN